MRTGQENIVWFGQPYVRARLPNGATANMLLDTGSASSHVTGLIGHKMDLGDGVSSTETVLGAAGTRSTTVTTLPRITLHVGTTQLDINRVRSREVRGHALAVQDGIFGNDLLRQGVVVIDPTAGLFQLD